jgi:hypothetical protein
MVTKKTASGGKAATKLKVKKTTIKDLDTKGKGKNVKGGWCGAGSGGGDMPQRHTA